MRSPADSILYSFDADVRFCAALFTEVTLSPISTTGPFSVCTNTLLFTTANPDVLSSSARLYLSVLTFRSPSVLNGRSPRLKLAVCNQILARASRRVEGIPSASSQARPAPKPVPSHTGHALRLNRSTEKITPKENPRPDRMTKEERARSHFSLSSASLTGFVVFGDGRGGAAIFSFDMIAGSVVSTPVCWGHTIL